MSLFTKLVPVTREVHVSSHKEVHEHRAPTDASVRLLAEFQDKAFDRLISTMKIKASGFEANVIVYTDPMNSPFNYLARIKFALGEANYDFTIDVPHAACNNQREMILAVHRAISDKIAERIVEKLLAGETRFHLFPRK